MLKNIYKEETVKMKSFCKMSVFLTLMFLILPPLSIAKSDATRTTVLGLNSLEKMIPNAYGTDSTWFDHYPKLAYDPLHNRFLVVFTRAVAADNYDVYGQLMNPDGTAFGPWFVICNALNIQSSPSVAYDTVNQRYLVVWHETDSSNYSNIYGQLVNADGTLYKTVSEFNFWISTATNHQLYSSVAYDTVNQRYLVAWQDYRNGWSFIYGQLVNADGTLYNTDSNTNFVISNGAQVQNYPSVAYDALNQRFLVVWHEESGSSTNIWGQLVNANGTLYSTASDVNFVISNATNSQLNPSVAYDPVNQRFLVVWFDHRGGTYDIYGQLVNAAGTLYSTASDVNFVISNATYDQYLPSVAFDTANQRFLVVWQDYRINSISTDIYGQLVNAVGTLYDTASNVNFVISNAANYQYYPSVAYNSTCGNFLTAYETYETEVWNIGFAVACPLCNAWASIPGLTASPPALAWNPSANKLQMVVRAADNTIWASTFNSCGTFNNDWINIPGLMADTPALAWNTVTNKLHLVARASNSTLWAATFNSSGTFNNDWSPISGLADSPPALTWNPLNSKLYLVVRASDSTLWTASFNSSGVFNNDWANVPGRTASPPALTWNPVANEIQMVVRASDDTMWGSTFSSSGIFNNDWVNIPGRTISPSALAWDGFYSKIAMMVRAFDNSMWYSTFSSEGSFNNDWINFPGMTVSTPAMAYLPSIGYLEIVVRAADNSLWTILY